MRNKYQILALVLLLTCSCSRYNKQGGEDRVLITVNLKQEYPNRKLILQDFMDVEYIALETSEKFLCQGQVLDIGENVILMKNSFQDGDLFLFDKKGKGINKINRKGEGNEEYVIIFKAALDESHNEIFVNDAMKGKILVYDFQGNFKRDFQYDRGLRIDDIHNFDETRLISRIGEDGKKENNVSAFALLSKQDGHILKDIRISFKERKTLRIDDKNGMFMLYYYSPIVPFDGAWVFSEASSDTIFGLSTDCTLNPFIVKTPSINSLDPEVFLFPKILTDRYCFMEKVTKGSDFAKVDFVFDRFENKIYEYTLYNIDYKAEQTLNMVTIEPLRYDNGLWQKLEAYKLVELYKKGMLQGKLKELASRLDEDANPVIMLTKPKR